jgi:hypothetical protein
MMRKTRLLMFVGLAVVLVGGTATMADVVTIDTSYGDGADTWVDRYNPDENNGSHTQLDIQIYSTRDRNAYLRFDLNGKIPAGHVVVSAELSFKWLADNCPASTVYVYGVKDGITEDQRPGSGGWDASTITWNNTTFGHGITDWHDPVYTLDEDFNSAKSDFIGSDTRPAGTSSTRASLLAGDTALVNFLNANTADDVVTFLLRSGADQSPGSAHCWSYSGDSYTEYRPQLIITTDVPEPATLSVLGLGMATMLLRKKRRG